MKPLQYFEDEYLERCKKTTVRQRLEYIETIRALQMAAFSPKTKSKLISLKVEVGLLKAFKLAAELKGIKYQTLIKELMLTWLKA